MEQQNEPSQIRNIFPLVFNLMKADFITSSISIVLDIIIWYLIPSSQEREIIITTISCNLILLIFIIIIYFSLKSNSLTHSQVKVLSFIMSFLLILSLIFTIVKFICFGIGAKNSEDKVTMILILIGINILIYLSSYILSILESYQIKKIVKNLEQNEINRGALVTNLFQNKTANSSHPENNIDDPNFKKEETIIIIKIGEGKTKEEIENKFINTNEKGREKDNKNIIIISQNKNKEEDTKSSKEKEKNVAHKQIFFQNQKDLHTIIYKSKEIKVSCSQEIISSLSSNRNNLKSSKKAEIKNTENINEIYID